MSRYLSRQSAMTRAAGRKTFPRNSARASESACTVPVDRRDDQVDARLADQPAKGGDEAPASGWGQHMARVCRRVPDDEAVIVAAEQDER